MTADETLSKGERTRGVILQAAHRLFLERGFHGTSMRQIAQEAGVALGGIYNHFATKDEIYVAIILEEHPINQILPALEAAEGSTVEDLIRDAARRVVEGFKNQPDYMNLLFIELVEFKGQHLADLVHTLFPRAMVLAGRIANQDQVRPIPVPVLLRAFLGTVFSYLMTQLLIVDHLPPEAQDPRAFDYFVDIFLHGILKEDV